MTNKPQPPQDVDEFIAEYSQTDHIRDEYGDTHYTIDVVDVDDLRAWMSGHVRVPAEFVDDAMCRTCHTHAAYMTNPCQWCRDREAMLNASKGE